MNDHLGHLQMASYRSQDQELHYTTALSHILPLGYGTQCRHL